MNARDWLTLALAMIVGAALRAIAIGHEALWADEALTFVLSQAPARALAEAPIDPTGPLYYWLHQLLVPDGAGAGAARSISMVAGVLTTAATYWLGRETVGRRGASFAAWWVAVVMPLVDYSQEARAYATLVLLLTVSAALLLAALRSDGGARRWRLAGFALTSVLAIYAHFIAWFWAGPALAILLIEARRSLATGARREAAATTVAILLAAIPEAKRVWRYATENNAFQWLEQLDGQGFAALVAKQWLPLGGPWIAALAAGLLLLLALRHAKAHAAAALRHRAATMVVGALLLQPLALWLFGFLLSPVLMYRTMLPSVPAMGIILAVVIATLGAPLRSIIGGLFIAAALVTTVRGGMVRPKEQWNATRGVLAQVDPARELIVTCPFWKAPALMAANRGPRAAPLMTPMNGTMLLVEDRLGAEAAWERLVYRRVYAALLAPALGVAPPSAAPFNVRAGGLFVVTSECGDVEKKAIADWAGDHAVVQRWTSPARVDHAGITVEKWQFDAPRSLPASVVR